VEEGVWAWDKVAGDLTDLAAGRLRRSSDAEITLFKSVGLAVQDLVIAQRAAAAAGILEES
jgi:ornithine cyclodeaminase/alanine dehydrogenase-like protein (mu-crystallin family)